MIQCQYELHVSRNNTYSMDRPHFHEDIEISLCVSGEGVFFLDNSVYSLYRGQLFLIDSSVLHRSVANEDYRCLAFHISSGTLHELSSLQSNFLADVQKAGQMVSLTEENTQKLEAMFGELSQDFGEGFGSDIRQTISLLQFLLAAFSCFHGEKEAESRPDQNMARVAPILGYIQENLDEPLTVDAIAEHFFMSKYHLCHIFKEATHFSLMDYIINCRILKARRLLRSGMRVQEVGETVGFRNNEHFIRTFKKLTGLPPKRYAKSYQQSDLTTSAELVTIVGRDGRLIEGVKE